MANYVKLSDAYGMQVFTEKGHFFGEIEEAILEDNIVKNWKIKSSPGSLLSKIRNAKGVIVPHKLFLAFGDICIIKDIDIASDTEAQ